MVLEEEEIQDLGDMLVLITQCLATPEIHIIVLILSLIHADCLLQGFRLSHPSLSSFVFVLRLQTLKTRHQTKGDLLQALDSIPLARLVLDPLIPTLITSLSVPTLCTCEFGVIQSNERGSNPCRVAPRKQIDSIFVIAVSFVSLSLMIVL